MMHGAKTSRTSREREPCGTLPPETLASCGAEQNVPCGDGHALLPSETDKIRVITERSYCSCCFVFVLPVLPAPRCNKSTGPGERIGGERTA